MEGERCKHQISGQLSKVLQVSQGLCCSRVGKRRRRNGRGEHTRRGHIQQQLSIPPPFGDHRGNQGTRSSPLWNGSLRDAWSAWHSKAAVPETSSTVLPPLSKHGAARSLTLSLGEEEKRRMLLHL